MITTLHTLSLEKDKKGRIRNKEEKTEEQRNKQTKHWVMGGRGDVKRPGSEVDYMFLPSA